MKELLSVLRDSAKALDALKTSHNCPIAEPVVKRIADVIGVVAELDKAAEELKQTGGFLTARGKVLALLAALEGQSK